MMTPLVVQDEQTELISYGTQKPINSFRNLIFLVALALALLGTWAASRLRNGSDRAEAIAVTALKGWYTTPSATEDEVASCRQEVVEALPFPEQWVVVGSYPVWPLGRYHVISYLGSNTTWYSIEFIVEDDNIRACYCGRVDRLPSSLLERTTIWP